MNARSRAWLSVFMMQQIADWLQKLDLEQYGQP
jgi:hypothetical protein